LPYAGFAAERFSVVQGRPVRFNSSSGVTRSFCARCGSPLTYEAERFPGEVHITLGCLDEANAFAPAGHVWTEDRVGWLVFDDGLPQFPRISSEGGEVLEPKAPTGKPADHEGRCLCGAVRYRAQGEPVYAAHCHCGMCRHNSGAAFMTFAGFAVTNVDFEGEPTPYRSSDRATRSFCARCGSPISFAYGGDPADAYLTLGTLERPEAIRPLAHWYAAEMVSWLRLDDDLPRYAAETKT
jgi:hypothetical protein